MPKIKVSASAGVGNTPFIILCLEETEGTPTPITVGTSVTLKLFISNKWQSLGSQKVPVNSGPPLMLDYQCPATTPEVGTPFRVSGSLDWVITQGLTVEYTTCNQPPTPPKQ